MYNVEVLALRNVHYVRLYFFLERSVVYSRYSHNFLMEIELSIVK